MGILIVVFVNVAFLILIFVTLSRKIGRVEKRGIPEELQEEMDSILTTFNRTADRNIDLLDDRLRKVEPLVERAERMQQQLDGLIRRAEALQKFRDLVQPAPTDTALRPAQPPEGGLTTMTAASAYRNAGGSVQPATPPVSAPEPVRESAREKRAKRKRRSPDEILREMTAEESPPEEIARVLGIPREEVLLKQRLLRLS